MLAELISLRERTGHPHFILIDEANHLLPAENTGVFYGMPEDFNNFVLITTRPELLCRDFLRKINLVMMTGEAPVELASSFSALTGKPIRLTDHLVFQKGNVMVWHEERKSPFFIDGCMPQQILLRHKRKYACGDMTVNSFFFRGPFLKLNLKASNLMNFIQIGQGVDDETWLFHLRNHDYSNWFKNSVKDEELAAATEKIERNGKTAGMTRKDIFDAILERYTVPG